MFSESVFHPTSGKLTQSISSDLEVWTNPQGNKFYPNMKGLNEENEKIAKEQKSKYQELANNPESKLRKEQKDIPDNIIKLIDEFDAEYFDPMKYKANGIIINSKSRVAAIKGAVNRFGDYLRIGRNENLISQVERKHLTAKNVIEFITWLNNNESLPKLDFTGKPLETKTFVSVNSRIQIAVSFKSIAVRLDSLNLLPEPIELKEDLIPAMEEREADKLNVKQRRKFEDITHPIELRDVTAKAFLFSMRTGLAKADIQKLTWNDVIDLDDFDDKDLESEATNDTGWAVSYMRTKTARTKRSKKDIVIPLDRKALSFICDEGKDPSDYSPELLVFDGFVCDTKELDLIRVWAKNIGVRKKYVKFHTARQTFANIHANRGTDIQVLSEMMGHATLEQTKAYYKVNLDTIRAAVSKTSDL